MSQPEMEMKSFGPFEIKSEDRGEVVAIVATLGVVDKDGDVIMPGAFPAGGTPVKLSGYGHDVITEGKAPVGKGTIREVDGKAVFEGKFFMSTSRGREAFHTTKELGPEGEWSFGFPRNVQAGDLTDEWKSKGAKRIIKGLQPIEASPVFVGAGWGTGTLLTKAAEELAPLVEAGLVKAENDAEDEVILNGDPDAPEPQGILTASHEETLAEPVETEEQKAAREAEDRYLALKAEALEEFERVQRALKRMGYPA